jgi:hypothetical protein
VRANTTAEATAERSGALEQDIQKLPGFLREFKPTMTRLGSLSDQMTPVLSDLGAQAPALNRVIKQLGPFSQAATPALTSLGDASVTGRQALVKSRPIITDLRQLTTVGKPVATNLSSLLTSFKDTGGIERLMDYIFYQVTAINGFDGLSHYLRAGLILNTCSQYSISFTSDCSAKVGSSGGGARAASVSAPTAVGKDSRRDSTLLALDSVLHGMRIPSGASTATTRSASAKSVSQPAAAAQSAPTATAPAPSRTPAPSSSSSQPSAGAQQGLLDYLMGGN